MTNAEIARAAFECYTKGDRAGAEPLYAADFTFTSPQDDHIDRAGFFERCFPTAGRFRSQEFLHLVEIDADDVLVVYEYELLTGDRYRNAEVITVRHGRVVETQVFFGGTAR